MNKLLAAIMAALWMSPIWAQGGVNLDNLQDGAVVGSPVERPAAGEMIGAPLVSPEEGKGGEWGGTAAADGTQTRLSLIARGVRWLKHAILALGLVGAGMMPYLVAAKFWQRSVRAYDRKSVDRGRLFAHRAMLAREDWGDKAVFPASALALVWIGSWACLPILFALRWLEVWQRRNPGRLRPLIRRVFRFLTRLIPRRTVRRYP